MSSRLDAHHARRALAQPSRVRPLYALLAGLLLLAFLRSSRRSAPALEPLETPLSERSGPALYAVADCHGDLKNAEASLRLTGLLGAGGKWVGGDATLVQTGDLVDRGPDSVGTLRLLHRLREEAQAVGGTVKLLLGNHEIWALQGRNDFAGAAELRRLGGSGGTAAGRRAWDALFDVGRGELGTVLAETHSAAALAGEGGCRSFFVHAGLSIQLLRSMAVKGEEAPTGELIVEALNRRLSTALAAAAATGKVGGGGEIAWDRRDRGFFGENGPFWFRGYALDRSESRVCIQLAAVLAAANATRMVVGHTVQEGGARSRCGGAMVLLDAGLSDAYYSRPTAFECVGGQASILERMPKGGVRRRLLPTPRAAREAAAV